MIGPRWNTLMGPLVRLLSLAVILFLFIGSIPLVRSVWPTSLPTVDWISNGWAYLAFTASFGLMALYAAGPLMRDFARLAFGRH
jgi:TRAP-type C4-dicarboxylate transport system permease small subunit